MLRRDCPWFNDIPTEPWVEYYRSKEQRWFKIWVGTIAIVDPQSKAKGTEKLRGRKCKVLWIGCGDVVGIQYLDTKRYGERSPADLIPLPTEPVALDKVRSQRSKLPN